MQECSIIQKVDYNRDYIIDIAKLETELGWRADENFDSEIVKSVEWYLEKYRKDKRCIQSN